MNYQDTMDELGYGYGADDLDDLICRQSIGKNKRYVNLVTIANTDKMDVEDAKLIGEVFGRYKTHRIDDKTLILEIPQQN